MPLLNLRHHSSSVKLQTSYLRHSDINKYLDSLEKSYKTLVKVLTIGHSYEKRPLKVIKISRKSHLVVAEKKRVFIDAGCHAREWISISCALYCIHKLVEYSNLQGDLLSRFDFYILPVVNPDGYEYSHTFNRFWRKTRRPVRMQSFGKFNFGTDLNRNYDFHWQDASANPSKYTYRGDKPFSEPETRAVRSFLSGLNCKFYLTLHSHAQALCYPWGFSRSLPDRWAELHEIVKAGRKAIFEATGTKYRIGNTSKVIKNLVGGSSADYAFGVLNIPFVFVMELPPGAGGNSKGGNSGFDPPCHEIKRIVKESWIGIREMISCI